jgi:hypothetical protein
MAFPPRKPGTFPQPVLEKQKAQAEALRRRKPKAKRTETPLETPATEPGET